MAGKTDQMKGNAKEAVGDLTGNKDLKSEKRTARPARSKRRSARSRRRLTRASTR